MKYKQIIFDIDGTILDTEQAVLTSLQETLWEVEGRRAELDSLRFILGIPGKDALKKLSLKKEELVFDVWDNKYSQCSKDLTVFPGVKEVLLQLKEEAFILGVITSKTKKQYEDAFHPIGFQDFFETVICAEDTVQHKPSPEPMEKYLERSGAQANDVLYVGDSPYDMACAQAAGVDCLLVAWGGNGPSEISADFYAKKPENILEIARRRK